MTRSIFDAFVTKSAIHNAWDDFWKVSRKQTASGIDGVTPQKFALGADRHIEAIHRDLKRGYTFQPLKPYAIEKANGKKRLICIGTVRDRIVQRMIADYLTAKADKLGIINAASFGFIKSSAGTPRGVAAARNLAVDYRQEFNWAYKTDITSFFDNIPREKLVSLTMRALRTDSFRPIIRAVVGCEIDESDKALNRVALECGIKRGVGVRQGMPLSPLLSNVVLKDFDRGMIEKGFRMVRYADDLIVLANSRDECLRADQHARYMLDKIDLVLPELSDNSKTQIASPDEDIEFLGLSLSRALGNQYGLFLSREHLNRIARKLGEYKDFQRLLRDKYTFIKLGTKIDNIVGGYRAAYSCADNVGELDEMLLKVRERVLENALSNVFGEDSVRKLTEGSKRFMGM
ncbi:hypothetical protein BV511_06045 [Methylorubrum extorquens]|uniref:reverse transcriptase domain-containing protein n=1 Tax=Methylorubrum extorquens TaxID=408 RepID=UPI000972D896|nr:reverse transcriptase domain-containing protein [Methylorubrum extorquens]APX84317.1 hypothetical protein BV511_06045 [Methylorubrum extorquens]